MKQLGDILKINGASIEPVDVITFGSPCQDLSIANGDRKGLDGDRSGLFMEAVRIIKEMRRSTGGLYPTFAVWENVPGAFSSNKGEDFRIVLEELVKIRDENAVIPRPPGGKWRTVGAIMGNGWSLAWRVFDAQFWGVPQRRRRIALVVDFRGQRAPKVLFEREGLQGDSPESGTPRERTAGTAEKRFAPAGFNGWRRVTGSLEYRKAQAPCIQATIPPNVVYGFSAGQGAKAKGIGYAADIAPTLKAAESGLNRSPCIVIQHSIIGREPKNGAQGKGWRNDDKAYTLDSRPDADCVCYPDISPTIKVRCDGSPASGNMGNIVTIPVNDQATHEHGGCNGSMIGKNDDPMYSLTATDRHAVCFDARGNGDGKVTSTMTGGHEANITDYTNLVCEPVVAFACNQRDEVRNLHDVSVTLNAQPGMKQQTFIMATGQSGAEIVKGIVPTLNCDHEQPSISTPFVVRRLIPLECERLQGYPDGWTDIPDYIDSKGKRKKVSDAARYRALGNSISIPNWKWVLKRISAFFYRDATLGSLFDGIGGFPYIWEQINNKGSARWASEIEEFPMAVTKYHFGEG